VTQYIYFDLGKVLLDFEHAKARRQLAILANVSESVVQDLIFDDGLLLAFETGKIDSQWFHRTFCEATNTNPRIGEFLTAYSDIFEVIPLMEGLVRQLHVQQIPLGILSNTSSAHWNHVCDGRFGFLPGSFRNFVLSYEVGSMKPDRAIYDHAIKLAECTPSEIFFCDDREENVAGASAAGFDAVLFETPHQILSEIKQRLDVDIVF